MDKEKRNNGVERGRDKRRQDKTQNEDKTNKWHILICAFEKSLSAPFIWNLLKKVVHRKNVVAK